MDTLLNLPEDENAPGLKKFTNGFSVNISSGSLNISYQEQFLKKDDEVLHGSGKNFSFPVNTAELTDEEKEAGDKKAQEFIKKVTALVSAYIS